MKKMKGLKPNKLGHIDGERDEYAVKDVYISSQKVS